MMDSLKILRVPPAAEQVAPPPFHFEEIEGSLAARFQKIVEACVGDRLAVIGQGESLTYQQLNARVNSVAYALSSQGKLSFSKQEPVALLLEQGSEAIAAILGILKSGHFYVPLDPSYPLLRNRAVLDDAGAPVLLTNSSNLETARGLATAGQVILNLDGIDAVSENFVPPFPQDGDSLAYILYTSGSTGQAKGVLQNHRNVLFDIRRQSIDLATTIHDRYGLIFSPSSSASVCHIFGALLNGASVCTFDLRREGLWALARWLENEKISILDLNVATFRALCGVLSGKEHFASLRLLSPGSEPVYRSDVELYRRYFPATCIMQNALGTTETRTVTQFFLDHASPFTQNLVPVGNPVEGKEILLLNADGEEVPPGESGEIAVRSLYLSPGYWRREDLTAASFLKSKEDDERRIYLTGDLGKYDEAGRLIHLGRKDFQVKIRGYRLEIAEVELALISLPGVMDAAAAAIADETCTNRLVAYLVLKKNCAPPSLQEYRRQLSAHLPEYAIPSHYEFLAAMPLTDNGKLSRRDLPRPNWKSRRSDGHFVAPVNDTECFVAGLFEETLGLAPVGAEDDFYALGGHSLLASHLLIRLEEERGVVLPPTIVMQCPTPRALAALLDGGEEAPPKHSPYVLHVDGAPTVKTAQVRLFCVPGQTGSAVQFRSLARCLAPEYQLLGFEPSGIDGCALPDQSIDSMASRYLKEMKSVQSEGPYFLCGYSMGGLVAYEMACRLRAARDEVALVALFDTDCPTSRNPAYTKAKQRATATGRWGRGKFSKVAGRVSRMPKIARAALGPRVCRTRYHLYIRTGRPVPFAIREKHLDWVHPRAARAYRPPRYEGNIHYIRAINSQDRPAQLLADGGWGQVVTGRIETHDIAGNHSLIFEPYVTDLAGYLRECLIQVGC